MINKRGQEEMVGFALIIIIVAIIFIVLLVSYIKNSSQSENLANQEANSFIQASLQYTTLCEQNLKNITLQELIFTCQKEESCAYGMNSCSVLNSTIKGLITKSWNVGVNNSIKGYSLLIFSEEEQILNITSGVVTNNYKGAEQDFAKDNKLVTILFNAYS